MNRRLRQARCPICGERMLVQVTRSESDLRTKTHCDCGQRHTRFVSRNHHDQQQRARQQVINAVTHDNVPIDFVEIQRDRIIVHVMNADEKAQVQSWLDDMLRTNGLLPYAPDVFVVVRYADHDIPF